jgi:hypothetical protein
VAAINNQLKGLWVFPVDNQMLVDASGQSMGTLQYLPQPALQFDGYSKVKIIKDIHTAENGTYTLSTKDGYIFLDITSANGTTTNYQVRFTDAQSLKLITTAPFIYYEANNPIPVTAVSNISFKKQSSADVTGSLIRVVVMSDTTYNVGVYVNHTLAPAPGDTTSTIDVQKSINGLYTYSFPTQTGDQLKLDIAGSYSKTAFYVYYNGIPMTGDIGYLYDEIKTTNGWIVP